jgi:Bacteriophage head to tail connecting protein
MPASAEAIVRRNDRLADQATNFRTLWQELAEYIFPRKSRITSKRTPGVKQTEKLFDSTVIHANELLAASMQGSLTSPSIPWFSLKMRDATLNANKHVADWLEDSTNRMYLAFRQSNFNSEIHEVYLDLGAFGTGAIFVSERQNTSDLFTGFQFRAMSVGEYVIDEDAEGRVDTVIRTFELTARAAVAMFAGTGKLPEDITKAAEDKPDTIFEFLHAVYPRREQQAGKVDSGNMPWASCYVARHGPTLVAESGFIEFPYMVPRWAKTSGEVYGRGPGMTALPDVRTLNRAVELKLKAWAKAIDPPLKAKNDGIVGSVKLTPGGITMVEEMENLEPLESGAKFDVTAIQEAELRRAIRSTYYSDQLQLQEGPQMTATEVQVRFELMQRILGPTLGRLYTELHNPLIERSFGIMLRRGALPPPPDELADGGDIDIEYEGPMARAQRSADLAAIERMYVLAAPTAQTHPEVLDLIDHDELLRHVAAVAGVPSNLMRSVEDVARIRAARAEAQQQQAEMQTIVEGTEAAKNVAPVLKALQGGRPAPKEGAA